MWPFLPVMIGFDWEHLIKKKKNLCLVHGNESCLVPEIAQGIMGRQFLTGTAEEGGPDWQKTLSFFCCSAPQESHPMQEGL